jgi:ribose 5-phosphate isomerase RpiB
VIRLGLRLTLSGGREAAVRLVLLVAAVGVGVGLLLTAVAGVNAVNTQNDRSAPVTRRRRPTRRRPPRIRSGG